HELGVGIRPRDAGEHSDVAPLVEPETARAAGDLCDLPGQKVAPLAAVVLRRLGEEQRLAGEVHAVPENVGCRTDLRAAIDEAVDLLPPRGKRHRAVEARDPARVKLVQLAGDADHSATAERDDHGAGTETVDAPAAG